MQLSTEVLIFISNGSMNEEYYFITINQTLIGDVVKIINLKNRALLLAKEF